MLHLAKIALILTVTLLAAWSARAEEDPLAPFNNDNPPRITATVSTAVDNGVEITRVRFASRPIPTEKGLEPVEVYAIVCRPTGTAPGARLPGILVLHGGAGWAEEDRAVGWARRGYVALAPDLPGIGGPDKMKSVGPFMHQAYGADRFQATNGDASTSCILDAVVAGLEALALLRSQPDVDRDHVGVVGISWGGYMTTMLSGLAGGRIAAAFSVYGSGYYDRGSAMNAALVTLSPTDRAAWLRWLDAGRRAGGIRCPFFLAAATKDFFFYPSAVLATLGDITAPKNYVFAPNVSHYINLPGGCVGGSYMHVEMEGPWFDYYLRGQGQPFPTVQAGAATREGAAIRVHFSVTSPTPIKSTTVYYAPGEQHWHVKYWQRVAAGADSALLPVTEPELPLQWYAVATDDRPVTVSTLIETVTPAALGFTAAERVAAPWREDFETNPREHWTLNSHPKDSNYTFAPEAAHGGKAGLELKGPVVVDYAGLRGGSLQRNQAAGLRLWAKNETAFTVELLARPVESTGWWTWRAQVSAGAEWHAVELPWTAFQTTDKGAPALPCPELGLIRLHGPEAGVACVDDMEEMAPLP